MAQGAGKIFQQRTATPKCWKFEARKGTPKNWSSQAAKGSSGASGGSFQGGASLKVEKAHFAAWKKGPENRKHEVKLRPPLCRPLKHSMKGGTRKGIGHFFRVRSPFGNPFVTFF